MERLNYHHLLYFFTVAHEGSVAKASARLGLKQPTVSAQIHALEDQLGRKLLERSGRGLRVTPAGETVLRYAANIFALGGELLSALDGRAETAPELTAGVSTALPHSLVVSLLQAVFAAKPKPSLNIVEGSLESLAPQLASRRLHLVLADAPPADSSAGQLHSRVLLESTVQVFAPAALARRLRKNFPSRLAGTPVLLHAPCGLRYEVESWLALHRQRVEKLAEMPHPEFFAAAAGAAIFAPSLLGESLKSSHGLLPAGELPGSRWRVFLVTAGKGAVTPGLDAVLRSAKRIR